jgi:drug/metabolite transporter (DMT)-like permease
MATQGLTLNKRRSSGLVEIHLAVMLFGIAGLFGKWLTLPAWGIVLGRTGFATLALGAMLIFTKDYHRPEGRAGMYWFALMGWVLAVHWITFFHAIQVSSVAVALLTFSTFPVFITWLEPWWFAEKRRLIDVLTSLMVVLGVAIMVYPSPVGGRTFSGALWGTVSGLTFAVLSLLNRKWVRAYPPVLIAFYQNAVAAVFLLPLAFWVGMPVGVRQISLLATLGVVCTALSHVLFIYGLAFVRAQLASVIACLEPVYGIALAYLLLHEIPSMPTLAGGAVILLTTAVATMRRAPV